MTSHTSASSSANQSSMRLRILASLALIGLTAAACDRALSTAPGDRVSASSVIVDAATATAALNGAYDALQSGSYYGLDLELLGDLASDNGQWAGTYQFLGDIASNRVTADNPEITSMWAAIYRQIDRDNVVLSKVPALSGVADAVKNPILGQASFLRALSYHNLVKFWGDVPMPLSPVVVASDAQAYTRTPQLAVYTQILSDLAK